MLKYILLWVAMLVVAVVNGAIRDLWYTKHVGELRAHQLSTATAVVLFGLFTWFSIRAWPPGSSRQAIQIGLTWFVMTLAFEFLFGHYVARHPWSRLLHDYDLLAGRVWIFVPVWIAVAPYVFFRLQR